jgi:hypothetical protein
MAGLYFFAAVRRLEIAMAVAVSRLAPFLLLAAMCSEAQAPRMPGIVPQPPFGPQQQTPLQQDTSESSTTSLKVTTRLTLESVTVTDAAGKPVHELKQSDFAIKEDGKPRKIKNFEGYGAEIPSEQSAQPAPPALPPHVCTNAPSAGLQSRAVNILLVDMLNTSPARQATVKDKAIANIENCSR